MKPKKKMPIGRRFQKGQSGNPLGGKLHNPVQRALKRLTIDTYREVIELALQSNLVALKRLAEDPNTPAVQVGVATALVAAIKRGDWSVVNAIAERIVGKIPDKLEVNSTGKLSLTTSNEDKKILHEIVKELENDF